MNKFSAVAKAAAAVTVAVGFAIFAFAPAQAATTPQGSHPVHSMMLDTGWE